MATNEISESDSDSLCSSLASLGSSMYAVPNNLLQIIFRRLSASDLCHVACCSRWLRDATNQDSLWRPLCQSRGWEHYGTTTDLAKIASYGPSKQATGATEASHCSVTFQNDRIVTDDNTAGLTSTCRWKSAYMRAYHLNRNWATNCSNVKELDINMYRPHDVFSDQAFVDGDLLAMRTSDKTVHVFDIRKDTLECVIREDAPNKRGIIKIKDGVAVVSCSSGTVRAFDARTGQMLQVMETAGQGEFISSFFDGELVIVSTYDIWRYVRRDSRYIYVWGVQDGRRRLLTMDDATEIDGWREIDYRNKLLAAAHSDNYIRVWDARSGERLHKLKCPQGAFGVKLGDNVIVGFSADQNNALMNIICIFSLDTGECQKEISFLSANTWDPYLTNSLIMIVKKGRVFNSMFAYDLRGISVTRKTLKGSILHPTYTDHDNGSKFSFSVFDEEERRYKEFIFEATPMGLLRLGAFSRDLRDVEIIWMDEIRMLRYDTRHKRLLIHHYW
ncbi:uncharacterized protein LOC119735124 [Patiria miniata]|uniref:F-box domain-containing protein n=1 Tax=Patiria miniata TaxID=46514 RepID=A0A914AL67_PATMI|nr:uncharacterized protein LOC119735124 [Patiria miniata]